MAFHAQQETENAAVTSISYTEHLPVNPSISIANRQMLKLPQLNYGTDQKNEKRPRLDIAMLIHSHHAAFKKLSTRPGETLTWKKATIEVMSVRKAFPAADTTEAVLAMTAWFHLLCSVDDEVEKMDNRSGRMALQHSIDLLSASCVFCPRTDSKVGMIKEKHIDDDDEIVSPSCTSTPSTNDKVLALTEAFITQCQQVLTVHALQLVAESVIMVWKALCREANYRVQRDAPTIEAYLTMRIQTVGLTPFFTILECLLCSPDTFSNTPGHATLHASLLTSIGLAVGLQNDIIGLEKDLEKSEPFNLILLLMGKAHQHRIDEALTVAICMHNDTVDKAVSTYIRLMANEPDEQTQKYLDALLRFIRTHYAWATHTRRYKSRRERCFSGVVGKAVRGVGIEWLRWKALMGTKGRGGCCAL